MRFKDVNKLAQAVSNGGRVDGYDTGRFVVGDDMGVEFVPPYIPPRVLIATDLLAGQGIMFSSLEASSEDLVRSAFFTADAILDKHNRDCDFRMEQKKKEQEEKLRQMEIEKYEKRKAQRTPASTPHKPGQQPANV